MKDPAFSFYYQDFLVGTAFMSLEATGAYIKCLCHQAHNHNLTEQQIKAICLTDETFRQVMPKFKTDETGGLYNERCRYEVNKRRKYSESRSTNRKGDQKQEVEKPDAEVPEQPEKKEKKEVVKKERNVTFPFDSDNFHKYWAVWKSYKATEHGFKYKSEQSEQAALMGLNKLASGLEDVAIKIILQSMENGWKGFFLLKTETQNGNAKKSLREKITESNDIVDAMFGRS